MYLRTFIRSFLIALLTLAAATALLRPSDERCIREAVRKLSPNLREIYSDTRYSEAELSRMIRDDLVVREHLFYKTIHLVRGASTQRVGTGVLGRVFITRFRR